MASLILGHLYLVILIVVLFILHGLVLLFFVIFFLRFTTFGFRVPIHTTKHKSLKLLDGSGTTLNDDKVWKIRGHSLVCNQAKTTHVILLSVHVDLEFQVRLIQSVNLEYCDAALIRYNISLMLATHLGLSLLSSQFIVFVPLKMSFKSLLHDLLYLLFNP